MLKTVQWMWPNNAYNRTLTVLKQLIDRKHMRNCLDNRWTFIASSFFIVRIVYV